MQAEQQQKLGEIIAGQRSFFNSGATLHLDFRKKALTALYETLLAHEKNIYTALNDDLGKSPAEAYLTELQMLCSELKFTLKHLASWAKARRVGTPLLALPGKSRIYPEPYGLTLNISPWNYPVHLALMPLISALAAGNCMVIKPSSKVPASAALLQKIIDEALDERVACVLQGDAELAQALLEERFDFIFYTGSAKVGQSVMQAAARHLTPLCLELGGKSPAIVLSDANLSVSARRIAWGKTVNAGQTCIAPDYVLADKHIKDELVELLRSEFERFPGPHALQNAEYARIINPESFDRLMSLAQDKAKGNRESLRIAPLVMDNATAQDPVMREEIFGPLLPVLEIDGPSDAIAFVNKDEKPLALYIFTKNKQVAEDTLRQIPCGGGCINDTLMHMSNPRLPFGGVGRSGMGRYHGLAGFELFSNMKGMLHKSFWPDAPLRYPPYSKKTLHWLKRLLG